MERNNKPFTLLLSTIVTVMTEKINLLCYFLFFISILQFHKNSNLSTFEGL